MGSDTYTYDANGNQATRNVGGSSYTLSYDAENRLVSVSGAATATFIYDGDGNRVVGTVRTTTTYIGNYLEYSNSGIVKYYYAGSIRVAMRDSSGALKFLLGDHLGSTSITTDSNGVKGPEIRYYPWGGQRWSSGTTPTTFRYTGQRLESSIGLYFYNARWYDPAAGRFIQADTIVPGGMQGLDRYAYVSNNPLKYTDPSGHGKESTDCGPDSMYCEPNRNGCNNMRCTIWHDYGVNLIDTGSGSRGNGTGPKAWDLKSTMQVFYALKFANNAVNGRLKSLIGGSEFTLNNYTTDKYHGNTGTRYIDFQTGGSFPPPYINIFHEVGHLIDVNSAGGDYYGDALTGYNTTWITPEGKIDKTVLINQRVTDPHWPLGEDPLQGTNHTGQGPNEQWADTFANYVAGNINVLTTAGNDMYNFTSDFFVP
jgi:RHS repeat-associated protein